MTDKHLSTNRAEAAKLRQKARTLREEANNGEWDGDMEWNHADEMRDKADRYDREAARLEEDPDAIYPLF